MQRSQTGESILVFTWLIFGEIFLKKQQYDSAKLYFSLGAENESKIQGNLAAFELGLIIKKLHFSKAME